MKQRNTILFSKRKLSVIFLLFMLVIFLVGKLLLEKQQNRFDIKLSQLHHDIESLKTENNQLKQTTSSPDANDANAQIENSLTADYPDLKKEIIDTLTHANTSGTILAIKNNHLFLNKGLNYSNKELKKKNTADSEFMIASIQKTFTATAIMLLVENDKLSLSTPLSTFYPDIPNSDTITIRQLLDMTSGLVVDSYPKKALNEEDALAEIINHIRYQEPSLKWHYSAVNYNLLAGIISKLTYKSYEDFIKEAILQPLNLKQTGFYTTFDTLPNKTTAYYGTSHSPYKKVSPILKQYYTAEIGTGNMYTSTLDLLTYFKKLINGDLLRKNNLKTLWTNQPQKYFYTYASGVYHNDGYFYSHGILRGYESSAYFTSDGENGIIFLSNSYNKTHPTQKIIQGLFNKITANK